MQPHLDRHPSDLQKACIGFIASLREPAANHAVYGQTRVNQATGAVEQVIVIHRHPTKAGPEFRTRRLPMSFAGYPVIEQDWPYQDL